MFTKFLKARNSKKGFTLVEVMVVVALIAILAAIAIPAYMSYRAEAHTEVCRASLTAIIDSLNGYNTVEGGIIDLVDGDGNILSTVTIQDAIDELSDKGMEITVDAVKRDAPLATYCRTNGQHFMLRDDVDTDTWVALYDDGKPYTL